MFLFLFLFSFLSLTSSLISSIFLFHSYSYLYYNFYFHFPTHTESSSMSLNPLFALKWFGTFLKECSVAYTTQVEGSLCSSIPTTLGNNSGTGSHSGGVSGVSGSGSGREDKSFGFGFSSHATADRNTLASEMVSKYPLNNIKM